jgi:hypothetical protein
LVLGKVWADIEAILFIFIIIFIPSSLLTLRQRPASSERSEVGMKMKMKKMRKACCGALGCV